MSLSKTRVIARTAPALLLFSLLINIATAQNASSVSTIFGNGKPEQLDGRKRNSAFNEPFGICKDKLGNLYVADSGNHCIRKISKDGIVSTFAGNGEMGTVDGPANIARFTTPSGVRSDGKGNLYVFSYAENSIRIVAADGSVRSLIKSRDEGYRDGTLATARILAPRGLVFDSKGNIFFTDCWNHRIRKISPEGQVTTLAGGGPTGVEAKASWKDGQGDEARFFAPCGLAIDLKDNLYVADAENHRIRKVTPSGIVTTLAGNGPSGKAGRAFADGPAAKSRLNTPTEVYVAKDGGVYFSDTYGQRIRKITVAGNVVTVAGSGRTGARDGNVSDATLDYPRGLWVEPGTITFADFNNHLIRQVSIGSASSDD